MEDAIYDSQAIRRFVGIDLSQESAPDATTCSSSVACWKTSN
jgi:IS5 family transposase